MRPLRLILAFLTLLLAPIAIGPAAAQTFPAFSGLVVDDAHVLSPATVADLTQKLELLQQQTHRQLVVATIADTGGRPLDDYGPRLLNAWGVGLRDVNNGMILSIAPNNGTGQRGPRIDVGRGLEGIMPDILAARIIDEQMMPRLSDNGDINGAMTAGADAIIQQLRSSPEEAQARADAAVRDFDRTHARQNGKGNGGVPVGLIFWMIVFGVIFFSSVFGRGRRGNRFGSSGSSVWLWGPILGSMLNSGRGNDHDDWGGGGWGGGGGSSGGWGGGGFTGGGGGSSGGGGASGSW